VITVGINQSEVKIFIAFIVCLLLGFSSYAQAILDTRLDGTEKGKSLASYLQEAEKSSGVRFYFLNEWINKISFNENQKGTTLREALNELFLGSELSYTVINANTIVIVKDPTQALERNTVIREATREQRKINKQVIGDPAKANTKKRYLFSGTVRDGKSKDPLIGVNVVVRDLKTGTITNVDGKYELQLTPGLHAISYTYVNFEEKIVDLEIYADGELSIEMEETPTLLQEIVVEDRAAREITTSGIGQTQLSLKEIKRAPAMLGEVDLIKQVQVLPGVTTAGEAASGYNVRGGSVDQNLILYDGLPVFNSSHVFGFFSSFNSEAIRDVTFFRGGIPAEYGGRVSSVLDIRSKEGSYEKWNASGGIGIVSTNLMVNGPLVRNKTSLAASFRTTYSDWLMNTVRSNYVGLDQSTVSFYDGAAKLTHIFSEKTKLTLSGYLSHDDFRLQGDTTYRWDTYLSSARIDHEFNSKLSAALQVGVGSYSYEVADKDSLTGFNLRYKLTYPEMKLDFHWTAGNHKIGFGAQSTYYDFNPGTLTPSGEKSNKKFIQMEAQQSLESAIYLADQFDITKKFHVDLGVRYSIFNSFGPSTVYTYQPGQPRETLYITDTLTYDKGDKIKSYNNFEPRVGLRYDLPREASLKFGYNRIYQYLHLVTNTTAVTPIDIWQPSGYYFKPQQVDQFSLGYFKNFKEKRYEAFVEVYYKDINNVLEFKDGAQLILNQHIETDLLQGKARAYGVETQVVKLTGNFTGSLSYAFSRSLRTIKGEFDDETINHGNEYASNFDQPHVVNLSWKYNFTRRHFFTGSFTYRTGRPITLPLTAFSIDNFTASAFSDRNQYRIPDYHRLDIGFVIEGNHKRKKILDGTWTFSVYNVYARKNPYSIFFKEARPGILRPYQLSIIGTALPSISYSFKI
jgi:hypothetical protein